MSLDTAASISDLIGKANPRILNAGRIAVKGRQIWPDVSSNGQFIIVLALTFVTAVSGIAVAASVTEESILSSLRAKRIARCPISAACNRSGTENIEILARFRSGSANLDVHARSMLRKFGRSYRNSMPTGTPIMVSGYTDRTGSPEHNKALSLRRATAIRTALMRDGIQGHVISVTGNGVRTVDGPARSAADRVATVSVKPRG